MWLSNKESNFNAGDTSISIPGSGRSPGVGNGSPLQHSCLENPIGREATVHRVTKNWIRLSNFHITSLHFNAVTFTVLEFFKRLSKTFKNGGIKALTSRNSDKTALG